MSKSLNSPSKVFEFEKSVVEGKTAEIDKMRNINRRPNITTEGVFREGVGTHLATAVADVSATQAQEQSMSDKCEHAEATNEVNINNSNVNIEVTTNSTEVAGDTISDVNHSSEPEKPAGWNRMPTDAQEAWRKQNEHNNTPQSSDNEKPAGWDHMPARVREDLNKAHEQKPAGMPEADWQKYLESEARAETKMPDFPLDEETPPPSSPDEEIEATSEANANSHAETTSEANANSNAEAHANVGSEPEKPAGWDRMPTDAQEAWRKQNEGNTSSMRKSIDAEVDNILNAFGPMANEASVELE